MPYDEDKNKRVFKLRPKQKLFVENDARFSFYVGGLGAGKTFAGAVRTLIYITRYPGSLGLVGAPTFTMLRDTTMRTFFELCPPNLIRHHNKNELKTTFVNGTEVLWRSMDDPDKCRGINLSWFWLDEAPFCGYYAWKVLKARAGRQDPKRFPTAGWATGTPKGKDGFYEDFEFKPRGDHFLVRASTWENSVNLPDGYIEGLGYEGGFALQEIEGRFEAFEGLVYSFNAERGSRDSHIMPDGVVFKLPSDTYLVEDYDRAGNYLGYKRVADADDVPDGAKVVSLTRTLIGVDWGYKNPAVCIVLGVDNDDRVWHIHEFYQRSVSREKVFIPHIAETARHYEVTRAYCDPAEPQSIADLRTKMDEEQLDCSVQPGENSKIPGISTVRSFLSMREDGRPGLLVHESCKNTIQEYGSYQYPTKEVRDRNPSELPLEQNDHCLVAGTMVLTESGEKPIESITAGEKVLTRAGWRHVLSSGMTMPSTAVKTVTFSNGAKLTGTGTHKIWVANKGWTPIDSIAIHDIVEACNQKLLSSTVSNSGATPIQSDTQTAHITRPEEDIELRASSGCTKKSGWQRTDQSLRDVTSIIEMATRSTTTSPILSASPLLSTGSAIEVRRQRSNLLTCDVSNHLLLPPRSALQRRQKAERAYKSAAENSGRVASLLAMCVSSAAANSSPATSTQTSRNSAPMPASLSGAENQGLTTSKSPAKVAENHSPEINTREYASVHGSVVRVIGIQSEPEPQPVYDLTVDGEPEFYANGILVHNSMGCFRYVLFSEFGLHRGGDIAGAATHSSSPDDIGNAEKALAGDDPLIVLRGHAASRVLRELDANGLVRDRLFRFDSF